jgi:glycerophosphoryl diester phosphodiesterase
MPPRLSKGETADSPAVYVYDLTYSEAQQHFRDTAYFQDGQKHPLYTKEREVGIPLLQDVFKLLDREVLVNIEIKTPKTLERRPFYDVDRLIKVLYDQL